MVKMKKLVFGLVFSVILGAGLIAPVVAEGEESEPVITDAQRSVIVNHCDSIKDALKSLQKTDSRTRVYLGRYYETILSNFMMPLNIRLVENSISNTGLIENQTNFAARRDRFNSDFITYQQSLEEVLNVNCKTEPENFYEKLMVAREKRATVNRDATKIRGFIDEQVKLVQTLKTELEKV